MIKTHSHLHRYQRILHKPVPDKNNSAEVLQLLRGIFEKHMINIILNSERVNIFSLNLEQSKTINFHHLYSTFHFRSDQCNKAINTYMYTYIQESGLERKQ